MPPSLITQPSNARELKKALDQPDWKFLESRELVIARDVQQLSQAAGALVRSGKKVCVALIERP